MPTVATYYEILGVEPGCSFDELRSAYRKLARSLHPDVVGEKAVARQSESAMADLNEAWRVLSDQSRRQAYDASITVDPVTRPKIQHRDLKRPMPGQRRQMWFAGVQAQMARLSRQAGRSATQTVLLRAPRAPRQHYEAVVEELVETLTTDAESRIRAARAAGAAPLDLGVVATLVGIRCEADRLRRQASLGVSIEQLMSAELLDRMWDVLAHELPLTLTSSLGGNPGVAHELSVAPRSKGQKLRQSPRDAN